MSAPDRSQTPATTPAAVDPLRACQLCAHHTRVDGRLHCLDATVCGPAAAVPCEAARHRDGGCGWNALRMHAPDLGVHGPAGGAAPVGARRFIVSVVAPDGTARNYTRHGGTAAGHASDAMDAAGLGAVVRVLPAEACAS